MSDLISREQAIAAINSRKSNIKPSGPYDEYSEGRYDAHEADIDELEELPSAEKTGEWIKEPNCMFRCSVCGEHYPSVIGYMRYRFCPHCGTRMVSDEDQH